MTVRDVALKSPKFLIINNKLIIVITSTVITIKATGTV